MILRLCLGAHSLFSQVKYRFFKDAEQVPRAMSLNNSFVTIRQEYAKPLQKKSQEDASLRHRIEVNTKKAIMHVFNLHYQAR